MMHQSPTASNASSRSSTSTVRKVLNQTHLLNQLRDDYNIHRGPAAERVLLITSLNLEDAIGLVQAVQWTGRLMAENRTASNRVGKIKIFLNK